MEIFRCSRLLPPKNTKAPLDPAPGAKLEPVFDASRAGITDYWQIICNRKVMVCGAMVLSALAACLLTIPQVSLYQAQTSIELQGLNENFLHMSEITPNMGLYSSDGYVQAHDHIHQSRS